MGLKTVADFRSAIRNQLESDSVEFPDSMVDVWLRSAATLAGNYVQTWPFFQGEWELTTVAGQSRYEMSALNPADDPIQGVEPELSDPVLVYVDGDRPLRYISRARIARMGFSTASSNPDFWTKWGSHLRVHPTPTSAETIVVLGYRKPVDWVSLGSGATSDMPSEFDEPIYQWALGQAYSQQEEPDTAGFWMDVAQVHLGQLVTRYTEMFPLDDIVIGRGYGTTSSLAQRNGY